MEEKEWIETVSKLIQLDIDAAYAYDQILDTIENEIMRERLTEFRDTHWNHVARLSEEIRTLGGTPPKITQDLKGYLLEAFTALRGVTGMKGALKALRTTEELNKRHYMEAVAKNVPPAVKEVLRKHATDERIHLDYIDSNLEALR